MEVFGVCFGVSRGRPELDRGVGAAAILDRLLHDAEVLTINGPSFRLKGRIDALRQRLDAHAPAAG